MPILFTKSVESLFLLKRFNSMKNYQALILLVLVFILAQIGFYLTGKGII
jgi:hypothetical protein